MEPEGSLPHSQAPRHLSISWARSIQSMPSHITSGISNLMLSSHLCLGLPSGRYISIVGILDVLDVYTETRKVLGYWRHIYVRIGRLRRIEPDVVKRNL